VLLVGALVAWWAGELKTVQLPEIALSNRDNFLKSVASLGSFLEPWWFHLWLIVLACLTMLGSRAAFARFLSVFPKRVFLKGRVSWVNDQIRPNLPDRSEV
jgi:hypothetical protein